jgi:hypothetical protein
MVALANVVLPCLCDVVTFLTWRLG